jgi:hypothetical protein
MTRMEYANTEIRIGGSLENTVIKEVSAPEIAVLRAIHGDDALVNTVKSRIGDIDARSERERLTKIYGVEVLKRLFPGALSVIPSKLADVGIEGFESKSKK